MQCFIFIPSSQTTMAGYSVEQHVQIIKLFYENGSSVRATFRALCPFYGRDDRPAESTIRRLVDKFESTGSVNNQPVPVRKRNARSAEKIAAVRDSVLENPRQSIPRRAQELGLSQTTTWRILRCDLSLHPYKKHLQTGDDLPSYNGKLRLFAMRFCPYAERSVLVLNAKKIQYDLVFINLDHKPEWIFSFSPKGTVPALEYEQGKAIFDSNIINVYLDEKYPEVSLQSPDPLRRAQDKMLVEQFAGAQSAYYTAAFNAQALQPNMAENYHKGLELLQKEIEARGTNFLHEDEPGLVDYTIWPFLERFEALPLLGKTEFAIEKSKYEVLTNYMDAMRNVPAVKSYALAADTHAKFTESRIKGDANYDMLD